MKKTENSRQSIKNMVKMTVWWKAPRGCRTQRVSYNINLFYRQSVFYTSDDNNKLRYLLRSQG